MRWLVLVGASVMLMMVSELQKLISQTWVAQAE